MICPRCTKNTDGVHTCTPTAEWRKLEAENAKLRKDAERYQWLSAYLVGDKTDLDDAIVACVNKDQMEELIDAAKVKS